MQIWQLGADIRGQLGSSWNLWPLVSCTERVRLLSFLELPEGAGLASKGLLVGITSVCVLVVRVGVSSCHSLSLVGSRPDALSQSRCLLAAQEEVTQLHWNMRPSSI